MTTIENPTTVYVHGMGMADWCNGWIAAWNSTFETVPLGDVGRRSLLDLRAQYFKVKQDATGSYTL